MKHCPEPSLRERLGKWARRHPGLCGSTSIALVALLLLGFLTVCITLVYDGMLDDFVLNIGCADEAASVRSWTSSRVSSCSTWPDTMMIS